MKCIVLPGLDGTGELFPEFTAALANELDVTVVSYPRDRQLSDAELATLIRQACSVSEPFALVAESYSTPLAIQYAASQPLNLKALILCVGFATCPVGGWRRVLGWVSSAFLFRLPYPDFAARYWAAGAEAPASFLSRLRSVLSSVQPAVLTARLRALLSCDVLAEVQRIRVSVLYVRAEDDRVVDPSRAEEIRRANPGVDVVSIPGPHLLLETAPQKTAEVVLEFLRRISAS